MKDKSIHFFVLTLILQRGVVAPLQPPKIVWKQLLLPNKLDKTFLCNHFYILYASFDVYEVKFGVSFGYGEVIKEMVEGVGKIPWLLFCLFLKYLKRYMLQTSYVDEDHHFLTYSATNPVKITRFYDFLAKNRFFAYFHIYFQCIQISKDALPLWQHSKIIWSSMVLILVSMDRGGPCLYTGSKYRDIRHSV